MIAMKWFMGEKEPLDDAYTVRRAVFIDEQNVPEAEVFNGSDASCINLVLYENDIPVSAGRVQITDGDMDFVIGRVATIASHRNRGLATGVVEALVEACMQMGGHRQLLDAQVASRGFYEKLGFKAYGEEFLKAGIPHIAMEHFGGMKSCGTCKGCGKH